MTTINDEWELTENSLKGRGKVSYYEIGAARLTETANEPYSGTLYDWPIQIAQKVNFNYDLFVEAFGAALKHFEGQYKPALDDAMLNASIEKGRDFERRKHG